MKRCLLLAAFFTISLTLASAAQTLTISPNTTAMQVSTLTSVEAWSAISKSEQARHAAKSFRSKMTTSHEGRDMEMDTEVVCPDRSHTKIIQNGQQVSEVFNIGGTMYMLAGGRTMQMPGHGGGVAAGCPGAENSAGMGPLSRGVPTLNEMRDINRYKESAKVTKGSMETIAGSLCQDWNIVATDPETHKVSNMTYCIGTADNLPRHITSASANGKFDVTYWDWNKSITINPPSQ